MYSPRSYCHLLIVLLAAFVLPQWLQAAKAMGEQPNIVYILADDLGYGDVAYQNPQSKIPTPNLDRLAAQGMRFTDAHDPTAVCTPTRYGILTGRYCWRSSLKRGVLGGFSPPLIEPGRLTVAALLKQHGYSTACIGKWHLGLSWAAKAGATSVELKAEQIDFTKAISDGPCTRGFDYFYGISASLDMPPYVFIENDHTVVVPTDHQEAQKGQFVREGPKAPNFRFDEVLPILTTKAMAYISQHAGSGPKQPFFIYFALNAPHTPVAPATAFRGKSRAGDYGDYVAEVDWTVGEILRSLDERKLADNTLVIFTSDNGPEKTAYDRAQQYKHYSMGDLRGVKRDIWEGGHRVPFLGRWPGNIKPNSISNEVICQTDLLATVAAIIGAKLPDNAGEDSYSILPALLGQKLDRPLREATVHHGASGTFAIRQGNWVLIDAPSGDGNKEPQWFKEERGYQAHRFPGELYDLSQDSSERRNLYGERSDKVRELKALLEKYKAEGRSAPKSR